VKVRISRFGVVLGLILLALVACLLYLVLFADQQSESQIGGGRRISDSFAGNDGTLYLVSGYSQMGGMYNVSEYILALAPDGSIKWKRPLNEIYRAYNNSTHDEYFARIVAADNDSVYLLINDYFIVNYENSQVGDEDTVLTAISSEGRLRWILPLQTVYNQWKDNNYQAIAAKYGRIYVNDNLTQYVLDKQGNVTATLDLVPKAAAIGPDGNFYVNRVAAAYLDNTDRYTSDSWEDSQVIQAYDPDGTMLWERNLSDYHMAFIPDSESLTFHGNTLYVQLDDGIIALDTDGRTMWAWQSSEPKRIFIYHNMPFDTDGNVYLYAINASKTGLTPYNTFDFYVISPAGKLVRTYTDNDRKNVLTRDGQIEYYTADIPADHAMAIIPKTVNSLSNLDTISIRAYDTVKKHDLWAVELPLTNKTIVTVTEENVHQLFPERIASDVVWMNTADHSEMYSDSVYFDVFNKTPVSILSLREANAVTSGGIIYVSLYSYSYDSPMKYGKARCAYVSSMYALDKNGTLLWQKPMNGNIYWMAAGNNSTVYYSTSDGRIFTTAMYVAGGLTVAAILYTLAHFFGAGTVARARSRLDSNENRNEVFKFIAGNPGSTMRDIARGLGINLGTIRYHMMILSLNHKTTSYQADGKHLRYFINSNAYSEEEQLLIASLRREGIRKVLESLLVEPNQSNKGLAATLGMQESAISRYTTELIAAGLVEKTKAPNGSLAYSISSGRRDSILSALGCITDRVSQPENPHPE